MGKREVRRPPFDGMRIPPQSVEAEQAVLGGLMLAPSALASVAGILSEDAFYRTDHRLIYRAIRELSQRDRPFDAVTIGDWFDSMGLSEQVAGGAYLIELSSTTPSAANIVAYAQIVREKATLRNLVEVGTGIVNDAFNPDGRDSVEILAAAGASVSSIMHHRTARSISMRDSLAQTMDEMQAMYFAEEDALLGLSTGFRELDDAINGLQKARVYGIGGRPKMGKTTLALNIADHVACNLRKKVAIFSFEMNTAQLTRAMIAARSGVQANLLQRPKLLRDEHWPAITDAMARLRDANIDIFFDADMGIDGIAAECSAIAAREELDLVVIDYMQIVVAPRMNNREQEVSYISRGIKRLANRLNVPVIVPFQLNRANEALGKVRAPRASDARESGSIEQDLDCMALLHRPSFYDKNAEPGARLELAIQRNGESGILIRLEDDLTRNRFTSSRRRWTDGRAAAAGPVALDGFDD